MPTEVKDCTGWVIVPGCLVKVWDSAGTRPWRGWVESIDEDDRHGTVLAVEHEHKGFVRTLALDRLDRIQVMRPTLFQESRRVGKRATIEHANEKLKRRRAASSKPGSSS